MKSKRIYFVVNCKKEEKKALKEKAIRKGFDTLAQYMRAIVRKELQSED